MASSSTNSTFSNIPNIPLKLNNTNYYLWRNIMIPLLQAYELLGYADGSLTAPPKIISVREGEQEKEQPNPDFKQWFVRDQFALTCILLGVSTDVGTHLVGVTSAHQAWTRLATLFESRTHAQFDFLEQQWRLFYKNDTSMHEYLKELKHLATQFALIGKPKAQEEINHRIVSGLGEDWEPLILTLAEKLSTMSTDDLSALLLRQERRRSIRIAKAFPPLSGLLGAAPPSVNAAIGQVDGGGRG